MLAEKPRALYEGSQLDYEVQTPEPIYTAEEVGQLTGRLVMIALAPNLLPAGTAMPEGELSTLEAALVTVNAADTEQARKNAKYN
jgi:hypothetical protein